MSFKLVKKGKAVRCKVRPQAGESRKLTASVRLAGSSAQATRRGRRALRVTLHSQRRLAALRRSGSRSAAATPGRC